jgi:CheY-like chemotaxis protein
MAILHLHQGHIMNVLYADDDEDDREEFCLALQQINPEIKITLSKDGQEALEILTSQKQLPNYIFLDVNMPRMNGIECMAKLKSDNRLKRIPIIIYSTTSDRNEVKKLITLGADDFISKQHSHDELIDSINKVFTKEPMAVHPPLN